MPRFRWERVRLVDHIRSLIQTDRNGRSWSGLNLIVAEYSSACIVLISEITCSSAPTASPEELIDATLAAVRTGDAHLQALLDDHPVPIYLTDAEGWVSFFNRACIDFAGRAPAPGQD